MNRKRLFKEINKLCIYLQNKYNINNGGCCYVAACIAEQLELYSIPFKIIHYDLFSCHYCIKVSDRYLNRDDYKKREISEILECSSKTLYNIYYERKHIKELFNYYCENRRT